MYAEKSRRKQNFRGGREKEQGGKEENRPFKVKRKIDEEARTKEKQREEV